MSTPQLLLMAAGIGARYGGLKQIDSVGPAGEILIDYSIYDALEAGFGKVVFIIRKSFADEFHERIGRNVEKRTDIAYVYQEIKTVPEGVVPPAQRTKPWGTGHAVLCAANDITAPFAAINADDFYGRGAFVSLFDYLKNEREDGDVLDFCMVGYVLKNTLTEHGHVARGVCTAGADGYLETIVERTKIRKFGQVVRYTENGENWIDIPADSIVSMNMWGFTPSVFVELESRFRRFAAENADDLKAEFYVPTFVNELVQDGRARAKVLHTDEKWFGITYRQDKPPVVQAIRYLIDRGVYPKNLWG